VTGGMLFDHIVSRGSYSEADAANIVKQILEAVAYMHANGIAHRDLKPENLLCTGKDNKIIKVTDFGLSKSFGDSKLVTACGTPGTSLLSESHFPCSNTSHFSSLFCSSSFEKLSFLLFETLTIFFICLFVLQMMTFEFLFRICCS
jgi:serine/threonine protein kinase